jgi:hypothetical protein
MTYILASAKRCDAKSVSYLFCIKLLLVEICTNYKFKMLSIARSVQSHELGGFQVKRTPAL